MPCADLGARIMSMKARSAAGTCRALGAIAVQRAPWHRVSRILFALRLDTLVGKVLDSARGSVFKPERTSVRAPAAKAGRLHNARDGRI
jgi:hypothetical protein